MKKLVFLVALAAALALGLVVGILAPVSAEPTAAPKVWLPVLGVVGENKTGDFAIEIQNVGTQYTRAVMFLWQKSSGFCEPQNVGPNKVECTGILRPGSSWIFTQPQLPPWATSALVYSFASTNPANPTPCTFLPADWNKTPSGGYGEPLAVEVLRKGPGMPNAAFDVTSAYSGISPAMTGTRDANFGSYMYFAPAVFVDPNGFNTTLYIQNAGTACTSIELWYSQNEDCLRAQIDEVNALAPGETAVVAASRAVGPGFMGSVWIRASAPLAIVVDQIGRDVLMTYDGVPAEIFNPDGTLFARSGSQVAYGPLFYREYQGWSTLLAVQNMSSVVKAKVKVIFLDESGNIVTTLVDWICPKGSQYFPLDVIDTLRGVHVGTIRVESQDWWSPGDPAVAAPDINAIAMLEKFEGPQKQEVLEAVAYNLFPEQQAFIWQLGDGRGGTESGIGVIGIPSLLKGGSTAGALSVTSELAIQNVVPKPGFTDFAIFIYDQNGLLDRVCEKLREQNSEYINLDRWGFINPGFKGSAVISATFWEHPVLSTTTGEFVRNLLGLAAVKVERSNTVLGSDFPGDESAASEGFPLTNASGFGLPDMEPQCQP